MLLVFKPSIKFSKTPNVENKNANPIKLELSNIAPKRTSPKPKIAFNIPVDE